MLKYSGFRVHDGKVKAWQQELLRVHIYNTNMRKSTLGMILVFWDHKPTQWHNSYNKITHSTPYKIVLPTRDQLFKLISLWEHSNSNHYMCVAACFSFSSEYWINVIKAFSSSSSLFYHHHICLLIFHIQQIGNITLLDQFN